MMVTFVSQCQKKALKRTRRVLDSFANRIGDNTWQTIITQEGLNAVQKLLRKTASKNTAVSCHWIRSRSRSEFLWVVGKRDEFNENGIVPVHYGVVERFIGEKEVMVEKIYANTNAQRLDQHLFAVGYLAKLFIEKIVPNDNNLADAVFVAGSWHDIGKIDPNFQNWIKLNKKFKEIPEDGEHIDKKTGKFSWQKYPRHNELSLLLFEALFDGNLNDDSIKRAKHAIFWHHAKPLREHKQEIKKVSDIYSKLSEFEKIYNDIKATIKSLFSSIQIISKEYENEIDFYTLKETTLDDIEEKVEGIDLPIYKRYTKKENIDGYRLNIIFNAKNAIARTAIVTADRLISSLTSIELDSYISNKALEELLDKALLKDRGLKEHIKSCLIGFENNYPNSIRNKEQSLCAKELCDEEITIGVLNGPAGCGKTKIALEWAHNTSAKKLYWICPRVQVCEGIYADLSSSEYLPNASIEIATGEIKKRRNGGKEEETPENELFNSDIVITTIDQLINSITTHKHITTFMDYMDAHVVFDEYHEYINMAGFNLLFAELIEAKKLQQSDETLPNTLLVSATPNPLFVEKFLGLDKGNIVDMKSFNNSLYAIEFVEYDEEDESINPLLVKQEEKNIFVISNTAITAQLGFIEHQVEENSILYHSKFIKRDKEELFEKIYRSFKKNGSKEYEVLRSGPVVQASLNITCDKMISEMSSAENFLQRLGRLDRFGENSKVNRYIVAITEGVKNGKSKGKSARFLNELDSLQSAKAWYDFLQNNLKKNFTINEIYNLYKEFYKDGSAIEKIEQDLVSTLQKSVTLIEEKVLDPKTFPQNKKQKEGIKIKKNSLRGDSLFVQMARCEVKSGNEYEIKEKYAYDDVEDAITIESKIIEGYGDSNKNLLSFMAKKHHNIKEGAKKAYKDAQLKNEARDPTLPIYLSYTLEDLKKVESKPHEYALYYAEGIKQPIGVLGLYQLSKKGEN